ncbi:hypothetical protein [Sinorhizobium saheli]|uniref:HEAT repeat domain-containing protein n=1 Tax=Sinorhizobium saheli TaxID=36856 RepID=A0A178YK75_SINSA|nr:hypothetical protein [Sinorhizobium saheli]MQW88084.1 hypothetical protein [Sinorhizobium saheli]OAP47701.1 hypothetical protein ATB98_03650 [Sinorhizobium saheli]
MTGEIAAHPTADLLQMIKDEAGSEGGLIYEAEQCLFKRWRQGIDLKFLVSLLDSETSEERLRGAYYLGEALPPGEGIIDTAVKLASDPHSYCRRTLVGYITASGLYDDRIAQALAHGFFDLDINVRAATINWAVFTTDDRFGTFSLLVEKGEGATESEFWREPELKRGVRALSIARRLRDGESVEEVRKNTPEEDSFTFDYLQFFEKRLIRYVTKPSSSHPQR